jgi:DNA-binding transcriptional LysR family regulator
VLKLDSLLAFVATAEAGSISEAARRLQISKSVASERLVELERNVGATLVHRSTRKLKLTEDGIAFLERAKRILHEVSEATAEVSERRGELVGPLRIAAPVSFGILQLSPALNSFLSENPRIELSVDLDDRFVGATDGFDAIIRHGPLPDNGWITKRVAPSRRILVASPDYLKKNGTPRTIGDLERHRGIIYSNRGTAQHGHACQQRNHDARRGAGRIGHRLACDVHSPRFAEIWKTAAAGRRRGGRTRNDFHCLSS